jgi:hypothetical protein
VGQGGGLRGADPPIGNQEVGVDMVAHVSYSGGRDLDDLGSRPAWVKS